MPLAEVDMTCIIQRSNEERHNVIQIRIVGFERDIVVPRGYCLVSTPSKTLPVDDRLTKPFLNTYGTVSLLRSVIDLKDKQQT